MRPRAGLVVVVVALAACGGSRSAGAGPSRPAPMVSSPCPAQTPLAPGPYAPPSSVSAAVAAVPQRYGQIDTTGFQVDKAYQADPSNGFGAIAFGLCGEVIGSRTWVVELSFPRMLPSADLSAGQLFLSRFPDGWKVWFQYH